MNSRTINGRERIRNTLIEENKTFDMAGNPAIKNEEIFSFGRTKIKKKKKGEKF